MNSDIVFYSTAFIGHLIAFSLALVIFSTIFLHHKNKGYMILTAIIILNVYTLIIGFEFSTRMGLGFALIDGCIGTVTYLVIRRKRVQVNSKKSERRVKNTRSSRRSL
ncbi:hypothetical protein [Halobacillus naozhouensis]|uniref:DUF2198 family protein n=1 Tax=Halobacillus naozhouensis TaxID=554880 RepID=A0ABY8IZA0_9BACI|nr:hypothetical protein [Halobacillus naozhouensis]WFT75543.1 hypothetical protein P9989_03880 [Halobacillus naozhouensis]